MKPIDHILLALSDREIARHVDIPFREAFNIFDVPSIVVKSYAEFIERIGAFYNHMFTHCIVKGALRSHDDAVQQACRILEQQFRREGGLSDAYRRAQLGSDGALSVSLEKIFEAMKGEATDNYVRTVFQKHFSPVEWSEKREIAVQLCARLGPELAPELLRQGPDAIAHDIENVIGAYVQARRQLSAALRRY